jgi:predicted MPP superfamily phosphohydrolase
MEERYLTQLQKRFSQQYLEKRFARQKEHSRVQFRGGFGFYWENLDWLAPALETSLKYLGILEQGFFNTVEYETTLHTFSHPLLPPEFKGFTILHLTDLHLDGMRDHGDELIYQLKDIDFDLCVITGDFRFLTYGPSDNAVIYTRKLVESLKGTGPILGILGNHDFIEIVPALEEAGIKMLVNESFTVTRGPARLGIGGVDDSHFYRMADLEKVYSQVSNCDITLLLAHSQELIKAAAKKKFNFYLSGHTHGGQLCLPGGIALIKNMPMSRQYIKGPWKCRNMQGYTSRGVGCSTLPVRYNCPPEIVIHKLV